MILIYYVGNGYRAQSPAPHHLIMSNAFNALSLRRFQVMIEYPKGCGVAVHFYRDVPRKC